MDITKESPYYQFAFEDGRTEEARKVLLHLGPVRFAR
jgi:hypothetical protein